VKPRAFTFVEIMVAVLIMATSLVTILKFLATTTGMSRQERAQAAAASYAAKIMNQYLYELQWTNLTSGAVDGSGWVDDDPKSGIEFTWTGTVTDAWPVGQAFAVQRTKYHNPCGGACTAAIEDLPRRTPQDINPVFVGRANIGGIVFKTIAVEFKWKGPGDTAWDPRRSVTLVARRGMLEEANQ
jgi:type II secretory pathway pseudopilin PulG